MYMFLGSLFILQFFLARAHGHKAFLYLSGCPLVKSSPARRAASCLHKSPKIVQIVCTVGAEKVVLDNV